MFWYLNLSSGIGRFYKVGFFLYDMGEKNILLKVHESYRWVVAVCDKDVFGRKLVESAACGIPSREGTDVPSSLGSKRVLDVSGVFFEGKEMSDEEVAAEIVRCNREDATFNFVGKESVSIAKQLGIVKDEGVVEIDGVPFALVLL